MRRLAHLAPLLLTCSSCDLLMTAEPRMLTQTGFEPRAIDVVAGVPFEWEATFRDADGVLVEPGYLDLLGTPRRDRTNPLAPVLLIEDEVLEPGRHRYRATALQLQTILLGIEWRTCSTNECPLTQVMWLELHVSPPVEHLHPLSGTALSLAVGERRQPSLLQWGTTRGSLIDSRVAWAWDAPLSLSTSDPAIARVVDGRIEGVSVGTATITVSTPATSGPVLNEPLPVTVTAAPIAPPAEGLHPVFDRVDTNEGGSRHLQPPLYQQLHVDTRGYPVTLGVPYGNQAEVSMRWLPALVAQWTGTGFEHLRIGRAGDAVLAPRLVLDARDHRYVLYRSKGGRVSSSVVIADFDADDTTVRYRDLPVRAEAPKYEEQRDVTTFAYSLIPRTGGGVWVAWVFTEGDLNSGPSVCNVRVRLAEVTDDAVRVEDVALARTIPQQTCNSHHVYKQGQDETATVFLVEGSAGAAPDIFLAGLPEFRSVRFTRGVDGAWTTLDGVETPRWPGGPLLELADDVWPDGIVGEPEPFRIDAGGETWFGNEHPGVLLRRGFIEDPTPRWFAGLDNGKLFSNERRQWLTQGVAGTATRMHQTVGRGFELKYGVIDLPVRATATAAETEGRLLATAQDPWVPTGLSVTSDGARFVSLRRQNARLETQRIGEAYNPWLPTFLDERKVVRAAADGQPLANVTLPEAVTLLHPVVRHADTTYAIGSGNAGLLLLSSSDGGLTFTIAREQAVGGLPVKAVFLDGAFFVACQPTLGYGELWRVGVIASDATTRALHAALDSSQQLKPSGQLVASTTTAAWLERTAPNQVRLVRWGADGARLEIATLSVPLGDINLDTVFAEDATLWGAGLSATARTVLRRRAGDTAFTPIADFDRRSDFRAPFTRIAGGGLANVELLRTRNDCFQSALVTSADDGVTWSAPTLLRPRGGCLQLPWQVTTTNDGQLALTMGDNHALRAWEVADGVLQTGQVGRFPAHDTLLVRAPLP